MSIQSKQTTIYRCVIATASGKCLLDFKAKGSVEGQHVVLLPCASLCSLLASMMQFSNEVRGSTEGNDSITFSEMHLFNHRAVVAKSETIFLALFTSLKGNVVSYKMLAQKLLTEFELRHAKTIDRLVHQEAEDSKKMMNNYTALTMTDEKRRNENNTATDVFLSFQLGLVQRVCCAPPLEQLIAPLLEVESVQQIAVLDGTSEQLLLTFSKSPLFAYHNSQVTHSVVKAYAAALQTVHCLNGFSFTNRSDTGGASELLSVIRLCFSSTVPATYVLLRVVPSLGCCLVVYHSQHGTPPTSLCKDMFIDGSLVELVRSESIQRLRYIRSYAIAAGYGVARADTSDSWVAPESLMLAVESVRTSIDSYFDINIDSATGSDVNLSVLAQGPKFDSRPPSTIPATPSRPLKTVIFTPTPPVHPKKQNFRRRVQEDPHILSSPAPTPTPIAASTPLPSMPSMPSMPVSANDNTHLDQAASVSVSVSAVVTSLPTTTPSSLSLSAMLMSPSPSPAVPISLPPSVPPLPAFVLPIQRSDSLSESTQPSAAVVSYPVPALIPIPPRPPQMPKTGFVRRRP